MHQNISDNLKSPVESYVSPNCHIQIPVFTGIMAVWSLQRTRADNKLSVFKITTTTTVFSHSSRPEG